MHSPLEISQVNPTLNNALDMLTVFFLNTFPVEVVSTLSQSRFLLFPAGRFPHKNFHKWGEARGSKEHEDFNNEKYRETIAFGAKSRKHATNNGGAV